MENLPDPRSTPITPETVANLDPKIQEILLRHANTPNGEQEPAPMAPAPEILAPQQPTPKQMQFPTFIEKSLPKDD